MGSVSSNLTSSSKDLRDHLRMVPFLLNQGGKGMLSYPMSFFWSDEERISYKILLENHPRDWTVEEFNNWTRRFFDPW